MLPSQAHSKQGFCISRLDWVPAVSVARNSTLFIKKRQTDASVLPWGHSLHQPRGSRAADSPSSGLSAGSAAAALSDGSQRAQVQDGATKAQLRSTASMEGEMPAGEP